MTGMLESTDVDYDIIKKWANTSHEEKNKEINKLLDEIFSKKLPYEEIEQKKREAHTIANMIVRKLGRLKT